MSNVEWIAAVREYVVQFGAYDFSWDKRNRMLPYIRGEFREFLWAHRHLRRVQCGLTMTWDLLDAMEEGMVEAVTDKLTQ